MLTRTHLILLLLVLGGGAPAQTTPAPNQQGAESYRISVDVDLVVLPTAVRDPQGRYVSDLREQDFQVYEDGALQRIRLFQHEDIPVIVGLVVDHSGSMRPKMAAVSAAARTFVQSSNPEDQLFVVNFNERVSLGLPGALRFSSSADQIERAIWSKSAAGETALYDAVVEALQQLQTGNRDRKVLIVISDGGDNASAHSLAQVLQMAEQSSAIIYTVDLFEPDDPDANPKVLNRLAQSTGGEAFFPRELSEVAPICERIARDIRNQYAIGYVSSNAARNRAYRTVRVVARVPGHGKLVVRTRAGYIAAGQLAVHKSEEAK